MPPSGIELVFDTDFTAYERQKCLVHKGFFVGLGSPRGPNSARYGSMSSAGVPPTGSRQAVSHIEIRISYAERRVLTST